MRDEVGVRHVNTGPIREAQRKRAKRRRMDYFSQILWPHVCGSSIDLPRLPRNYHNPNRISRDFAESVGPQFAESGLSLAFDAQFRLAPACFLRWPKTRLPSR